LATTALNALTDRAAANGIEHVFAPLRPTWKHKYPNVTMAEYAFPGIENERVATGMAGFVGSLGVFALGYGLAFVVRRARGGPSPPPSSDAGVTT
jgi:hypothetical protein